MARPLAYGLGFAYVLLGVIAFAWTGFGGWVEADGATILGVFELNPTHNLAHLAVGTAFLWAATETAPVLRIALGVVGLVYLGLGIAGFWLTGAPDYNVLALNTADNWLHIATGAVALVGTLLPTPSPRSLDAR